MPKYYKES